jgi:hypothetical protein
VGNNPVVFVDPDGNARYYLEGGTLLEEHGSDRTVRVVDGSTLRYANKLRRTQGDAAYFNALSEGSRLGFNSAEAAAISWADKYNGLSVFAGQELGSRIYRFETKENDVFYTYSLPAMGIKDAVVTSELGQNGKILTMVADIHSHGKYIPKNGEGNNIFSSADKITNYADRIPGYVATPDGSLKRWDPKKKWFAKLNLGWWRGKSTTLTKTLARDQKYK